MGLNFLSDWDKWKRTLASAVDAGQKIGMEDETIDNIAFKISDFLADIVKPRNPQETLLQELWKVGSEDEKRALTKMVIKMVNNSQTPEEQKQKNTKNN